MHSTAVLPDGYKEIEHINLQKDKKSALKVNVAASIVMIAMFSLGHFAFVPFTELFSNEGSFLSLLGRWAALIGGYIAYIILHELTHGLVMKLAGGSHTQFGFTGLYAYAGSKVDYFNKPAYIAIALAPLVIWGILLMIPLVFTTPGWFWVFYFWQVGNIAGAAGDVYVTAKVLKLPSDILVMDTGVEMFFYSKA